MYFRATKTVSGLTAVRYPAQILFVLAVALAGCGKGTSSVPPTEKKPVTDTYYGISVVDNYRWLDNINDPVVRKWNDEQNAYTRQILDVVPARDQMARRIEGIANSRSSSYFDMKYRGQLFALKSQPPKNHSFIVTLRSVDDTSSAKTIVDPNELDPQGRTAIDWYVPSRDGKLVAVSLSLNGSEDGSVNVFNVPTGDKLSDLVPRAQFPTASGSLEWNADNTGFYYTRYPQGEERPREDMNFYQQIYYHKIGTSSTEDTYVIGKEFPRIAECALSSSDDGKYFLVSVANGDGGEFAHYLMSPSGRWSQITTFQDKVVRAEFGRGDGILYLLSHKDAPNGKILSLSLTSPRLSSAKTVIPESGTSISDYVATADRIFVVDVVGGPMRVRVFDVKGKEQPLVEIPPVSSVYGLACVENGRILYSSESYLEPAAWYLYDSKTGSSTKTALTESSPVSFADVEVVREFARSKDGSSVPMNILRRKGTALNGQNPTILYGYGGFGISESPYFHPMNHVWLEQGGIFVIANLRGGGEFGEKWHDDGKLTKKQNVFDDFAACAKHLIDTGYTNPSKLAIEGGSNGGLLMGAVLTQHPDLFRAVLSSVGIYDMLRVELFPNGSFNITEYGSVKDPEHFKALFAYSPYHHVVDGTAYPALLFMTGDNDGRVDPANSRKMTARLQAATSSGLPIMLHTNAHAGHGFGTSLADRIAQQVDEYCFLVDELKIDYKPVEK